MRGGGGGRGRKTAARKEGHVHPLPLTPITIATCLCHRGVPLSSSVSPAPVHCTQRADSAQRRCPADPHTSCVALPPSLPPSRLLTAPALGASSGRPRHKQDEPAATGGLGSRHLGRLPRFPPGAHGGGRPPRCRAGRMLQRTMQRRPLGLAARQRWRSGHHLPP